MRRLFDVVFLALLVASSSGADECRFEAERNAELERELGVNGAFVVGYIGTIGMAVCASLFAASGSFLVVFLANAAWVLFVLALSWHAIEAKSPD